MFFLFYLLALVGVAIVVPALIAGVVLGVSDKPWSSWAFVKTTAVVFASLGLLMRLVMLFFTPMNVDAGDIYGEYVIDRTMFPGKNADWQYETYRMEITEADELKLYQFRAGKLVATHQVPVSMLDYYANTRLKLEPGNVPHHHMLRESPLMVRRPWSFYYAFNSPHYGSMYFRKAGWFE